MFKKVLVANRGEIAVRIIRACRDLGLKTAAVFSEADRQSLHAALADEGVCLAGFKPADTYLNMDKILRAARETGAQAIHPGYGYLAENEKFAARCREEGFVFIGPSPENIRLAGNKLMAREMAAAAGVPVIPGSARGVVSRDEALAIAAETGYPVMIKASAGGGGRGMRICSGPEELKEEFSIARAEAAAAFGNDTLYIERYLQNPRHIEFQILGDSSGRVVHLGDRECSVQRRYQKLLEEAPSPALDGVLREKMGAAALKVAQSMNYFNAGTVEFILDEKKNFYFMEINSRIQVEHPVTEMVTGIDLVKEQIRLSAGECLDYDFSSVPGRGWAIECRINAEDPENSFLPSPGTVERYRPPGGFGVRLDTHVYQGYSIPPYYDSLLAKLIAWGPDRKSAISVMSRALREFVIEPVKTTIPLHRRMLADKSFADGDYDTGFVRKFIPVDEDED
ncbi:MAG: acetyl-CoA carboxylase biotin carboxylase subunit [Peptococcaceae bacterium]|nr:acetyl-CoA carboxylase biotin carboxylase subunit [Peptococcaceae bacterium]